jgi:hypothetical protein
MPAANTDYFTKIADPGNATTLAAPGHSIGGTTINVDSTALMPTTTGIFFAIDTTTLVNGVETRVAGTYTVWEGTVASATSISNMVLKYGTDQNYSAGASTRVYVLPTAARENQLVDGLLVSHDQDGTLKAGAVDNAACLASDVVETAKIKDAQVTNAKLSTTAGDIGGAWKDWVPTATNFDTAKATLNWAKYSVVGKTLHFKIKYTLTNTAVGTDPRFTLPVTISTDGNIIGSSTLVDSGTTAYTGYTTIYDGTNITVKAHHVQGSYIDQGQVSASAPFTWTSGDSLYLDGACEIA